MFFTITNEKQCGITQTYKLISKEIIIQNKHVLLKFRSENFEVAYELSPDDRSGSVENIKETLENFIKKCFSKKNILKINEYPIRNMILLSWQDDIEFDSIEFTWYKI